MKILILAIALVFSSIAFAEDAAAPAAQALPGVIPSDFNLADVPRADENRPLSVQEAVEQYLAENPQCEDQPERICEVRILRSRSEKCGKGFKLADASGWQLNATSFKARQYDRSPSQGGSRPPGQSGHRVYGFGVCHKF